MREITLSSTFYGCGDQGLNSECSLCAVLKGSAEPATRRHVTSAITCQSNRYNSARHPLSCKYRRKPTILFFSFQVLKELLWATYCIYRTAIFRLAQWYRKLRPQNHNVYFSSLSPKEKKKRQALKPRPSRLHQNEDLLQIHRPVFFPWAFLHFVQSRRMRIRPQFCMCKVKSKAELPSSWNTSPLLLIKKNTHFFCRHLASSDSKQALQKPSISYHTGKLSFSSGKTNHENWGAGMRSLAAGREQFEEVKIQMQTDKTLRED